MTAVTPAVRAIRDEVARHDDNLARAHAQRKADPEWRSGNDETIDEVIVGYQANRDALLADATRLGIELA